MTLLSSTGDRQALSTLSGAAIAAFCGIGNPLGFQHTLRGVGCQIAQWREFPDHHRYSADDVAELDRWVRASGAEAALCTHKDLVKLQVQHLGGVRLWALVVEMQFLEGGGHLENALQTVAALVREARPGCSDGET